MLELRGVGAGYETATGLVPAVAEIDLSIGDDEVVGIAGESGCGKSSLLKVMYGDLTKALRLTAGSVRLATTTGAERRELVDGQIRRAWWKDISYVPQGAMSVLNPVARVETQFLDSVRVGGGMRRRELRDRVCGYLEELHLRPDVLRSYPHQLSGGMRQRVVIAMATFSRPAVVLADEPTTGLDVVVQRDILTMLANVRKQTRSSLVIVSHDMGVHYQISDRMLVMYAGRVVEQGPTAEIFGSPKHPYTRALIESLPRLGDTRRRRGLDGVPPRPSVALQSCPFADRCPEAMDVCRRLAPPRARVGEDHHADCHLWPSGDGEAA